MAYLACPIRIFQFFALSVHLFCTFVPQLAAEFTSDYPFSSIKNAVERKLQSVFDFPRFIAIDNPEPEKPDFRWPARGTVIHKFQNTHLGIDIALPMGTPVKAAESGIVAYAGSELKRYGNLILIRHPNGFVSMYGNNSELKVRRGETVKRGQLIAMSGATGNVTSPQLHFEIRKDGEPVNPTGYLSQF